MAPRFEVCAEMDAVTVSNLHVVLIIIIIIIMNK